MPATYNKYNSFVEYVANNIIDIFGTTHVFKVALSNTAPSASAHTVRADITEITAANGYVAGGNNITFDSTRTGGIVTATAVDTVFTAAGGTIGPFRYAILYDDTPTSPADPLMCWFDYLGSITLNDTEIFTVDFPASLWTFQ